MTVPAVGRQVLDLAVARAWLMTGTMAAASWRVAAELPLGA